VTRSENKSYDCGDVDDVWLGKEEEVFGGGFDRKLR
jgi:hypothetical protein